MSHSSSMTHLSLSLGALAQLKENTILREYLGIRHFIIITVRVYRDNNYTKKKKMGILRCEPTYRIAAGGGAGLTEILLFHPLDVIKTRLQSQVPGAPDAYKEHYNNIIYYDI